MSPAKKKCPKGYTTHWMSDVKNCRGIKSDATKVKPTDIDKAVQSSVNQGKCVPIPKGRGGSAKEFSEWKNQAEESAGYTFTEARRKVRK